MATHSSVLAWRIPGMGEPGGLPSMGSHRVGHDQSDLAAAAACMCVCVCMQTTLNVSWTKTGCKKIQMHKTIENKLKITNLKILIFIKINSHNSYNMDYHLDRL